MGWIKYEGPPRAWGVKKPLLRPQQTRSTLPQQPPRPSSLERWMKESFEALSDAVAYNEKMLAQGYNSYISSPCWTVYARKLTAREKRGIREYRKLTRSMRV